MATCFLCGTKMAPRFETRDHLRLHVPTQYAVEWCVGCGFGRVAGEFTPADVAAFYTSDYYTHVTQKTQSGRAGSVFDRLRVHLAWRTDRGVDLSPREISHTSQTPTLCDVGCGGGQAMSAFKQAGYEVVGIEPDPAARALAAKAGEVLAGTAEAIPAELAGREFDVVLLSHVLEHCIDPAAALANVKRLLAPNGTAVLEVPNNDALGFALYGPAWFFADVPRHLQFFTEASLRQALMRARLRVTRVLHTGYTRQFMPQWLAAQDEIRERAGLESESRSAWSLLARTAFAGSSKKYDSIRVHAMHADGVD